MKTWKAKTTNKKQKQKLNIYEKYHHFIFKFKLCLQPKRRVHFVFTFYIIFKIHQVTKS